MSTSATTNRVVSNGPRAGASGSSLALATGAPCVVRDAEHVVVRDAVPRAAGYLSRHEQPFPRETPRAVGSAAARVAAAPATAEPGARRLADRHPGRGAAVRWAVRRQRREQRRHRPPPGPL